ncbi:MAG: hypothetical protein ACTHJT_11340 [Cytophaga sp.]|uniref:hypothetical protein n=1 Tax=Cytophaga sp. TaxID=29535 RepID=UPI003F82293F
MGWKTSLIIISRPPQINDQELLKALDIKGASKQTDVSFEDTIGLYTNKVCIGNYNGYLIIYEWAIPETVIQKNETAIEKKLIAQFPNSEICFLVLISTLNFWGYKIVDNGKVIRHRAGDGQGNGTYTDFGDPLEEEKDLLAKSTVDNAGVRTYRFDSDPDEIFTEDQVGEEFVFNICKKYLGAPLDQADEFLNKIRFACYQKKSWWKFWK